MSLSPSASFRHLGERRTSGALPLPWGEPGTSKRSWQETGRSTEQATRQTASPEGVRAGRQLWVPGPGRQTQKEGQASGRWASPHPGIRCVTEASLGAPTP